MEEKNKIENLISDVKEYAEERMNFVALSVHEKTSKAIASTTSVIFTVILGLFMLGFLSTAVAWVVGEWLGQTFLGFLIVGLIYLVAAILIWVNREKWIRLPVMNAFLKNISDDED